jgi:LacI family transcriptional regulator
MSGAPRRGSLADVSRLAGVSVATASRVLNGSTHPVAAATRERVLAAAQELGYSPSALAQALVTKRSRIIGVIVGDVVDPYFAEITRGVEDVAGRAGYLTIVCNADRRTAVERQYLDVLRDYRAVGAIFAGSGAVADDEEAAGLVQSVERARDQGMNVIALATRSFPARRVAVDNRGAAYDLTDYLVSLGHARIAFVTGPTGFYTSFERLEGFQAALRDRGILPGQFYEGDFSYEAGQAAAARMLAERGLPDAIIGANDETAIGVLTALRQAGVDVPGTVSVAGIGNTRLAHFLDLTTVSIPTYELGAIAAQRVLAEEPSPADAESATILPHRLVMRATTSRRGT